MDEKKDAQLESKESLDCQGCLDCSYSAKDKTNDEKVVFHYHKCDVDGICYTLSCHGFPEGHALSMTQMCSGHEELETLVTEHCVDIEQNSCGCRPMD